MQMIHNCYSCSLDVSVPWLYQLRHPWHSLTSGQNATAFGILVATAVNMLAVIVLIRTTFGSEQAGKSGGSSSGSGGTSAGR
jgi:hypothetical protein